MDIHTFDFVWSAHATNQRGVTPAHTTQHTSDSQPVDTNTHTHTHTQTLHCHHTRYTILYTDTRQHHSCHLWIEFSIFFFYSLQQPFARRGGGFFRSAFVIPQNFCCPFLWPAPFLVYICLMFTSVFHVTQTVDTFLYRHSPYFTVYSTLLCLRTLSENCSSNKCYSLYGWFAHTHAHTHLHRPSSLCSCYYKLSAGFRHINHGHSNQMTFFFANTDNQP